MIEVADHNDGRWLVVVYRDTRPENARGWVVIRTCPCHAGERVTIHYPTREQAGAAAALMLAVTMTLARR
jgi:hypothetical protein